MIISEMNSRLDLPSILPVGGVGVELGVAAGYYSNIILERSKLKKLYSVDVWCDHHDDAEYRVACDRLAKHGDRSTIIRAFFVDAIDQFEDNYFDFIYIDAYAHLGQEGGSLMRNWYPKLKKGGIMGGHDYTPQYQPTIDAVDSFCDQLGFTPIIIPGAETLNKQDMYPSWYVYKV